MLPQSVLRKSKITSLLYVPPPTLCTVYTSARFSPVRQLCVYHIVYTYIHTRPHSLVDPPLPQNTHKGSIICILTNAKTQKEQNDSNKEKRKKQRGEKRDRQEEFGGRSLEKGSGWWSGYICKCTRLVYLGLYTRVSTHLIMACLSVPMANKQRQPSKHAHACARSHGDMLAKGSLVDLFSLVSYIVYSTRV